MISRAERGGFGFGIAGGTRSGTGSQLVAYLPGAGWIGSEYTFPASHRWYHVVMTRDGSTVRFYVNDVQTTLMSTLSPASVAPRFIVCSSFDLSTGTATHFFTGAISSIALHTSSLSPAQIRAG